MKKRCSLFFLFIFCFFFASCSKPHLVFVPDNSITDYVDIEVWYHDFTKTYFRDIPSIPIWEGYVSFIASPTVLASTSEGFDGWVTIEIPLPDHFTFVSYHYDESRGVNHSYNEDSNQLTIKLRFSDSFDILDGTYKIEAGFYDGSRVNPHSLPSHGKFSLIPSDSLLSYYVEY